MHTTWLFNSTLEEKRNELEIAHDVAQSFRDISPGSGAYFVRLVS